MSDYSEQEYVLRGDWQVNYPVIDYGKGIYLFDKEGKKYLDAIGGIHVVSIGHGVTEIGLAIYEQVNKVAFVNRRQFMNEPMLELAEIVVRNAPSEMNRVYFVSGGSEANEMALQIAYQYHLAKGKPNRYRVIGRWHSYHGFTVATESMGGHLLHRRKLKPFLLDFPHIQAPHCFRCPLKLKYPSCEVACATDLKRVIEQEDPETIAAFIAEPIIGSTGGAIVPPQEYYKIIRQICDEYDILFIADEVVTGFGRTGKMFGMEHWSIVPDIITAAKGLSSGYAPIGAIIVNDKIWETVKNNKQGKLALRLTYSGNPVCCAAAVAVQNYLAKHNLVYHCNKIGEYLKKQLDNLKEETPIIGDVRGKGLLLAIEFVEDRKTRKPFSRSLQLSENIVRLARENGLIIVGGSGSGFNLQGDHILISPPFIITEKQCDEIISILKNILNSPDIVKRS